MIARLSTATLWAFCLIVFSKVYWYDLKGLLAPDERRYFLTDIQIVWVGMQAIVAIFCFAPLLRNVTRPAMLWSVLIIPYFFAGFLRNDLNAFFLNDLARYTLPIFWLSFFVWAIKRFSVQYFAGVVFKVLAGYMVLRTLTHFAIDPDHMRYGRHWELFVPISIMSISIFIPKRILLLAAAAILASFIIYLGQGRALIFGIVIAGALTLMLATIAKQRGLLMSGKAVPSVAAVVFAIASFAAAPSDSRLDISDSLTIGNVPAIETTAKQAPVNTKNTKKLVTRKASASVPGQHSPVDMAKAQWEASVNAGGGSFDTRYWEAVYFLRLAAQDPLSLLFGVGAGHSVSIDARGAERMVRGAHNTYATLVYRHGAIIGMAIILFVCFYGMRRNWREFRSSDTEPHMKALFLALIVYRVTIIGLSLLHQGLFDDPLVWLAIALSSVGAQSSSFRNRSVDRVDGKLVDSKGQNPR